MKKFLALLLSMLLCLSLFAACGGDKEEEKPADDAQTNEPADNNEEEAGEKHFRTYLTAEPSTLDVSRRSDSYSSSILINTVESLVNTKQVGDSTEKVAGDAESWEVDETGTVWTFHLNPNAKWEDGEPVTAEQYVYSLQRSSAPETGCPNAFFLQPIKNFAAVNSGEMAVSELGVKAIDEKTLEITLEAALPAYLDMLSSTIYYAQRQDIVEKHGEAYGADAETFIANSAFKVESWTHNNEIVLVKNDQYWNADEVKLDKITYKILSDENTYYNAFEAGEIDYVSTGSAEWLERFAANEENVHMQYPGATLTYFFFNCADELFQNANIRKAFSLSIDREELNEMCFSGLRTPTYGWVVTSMTVGSDNFRATMGDPVKDAIADIEAQGKTMKDVLLEGMAELGLGDDPSTLDVTMSLAGTSEFYRTLGDYVQQTWATELGVNVEISFSEWGIFYDAVENGNYQMGMMGWGAYYNDPYDTLSLFVSSTDAIMTNWESAEFDAMIAKGSITLDDAERMQIYADAERIAIYDHCVAAPLATNNVNIFVKDYVQNYPFGTWGNEGLRYVDIVK